MTTTRRYPVKNWTVIAVPEDDGETFLTRPYAKRNLKAGNALDAIAMALEPSAFQVGAMLRAMGMDESQYDWMRNTLLQIFAGMEQS
jgi:hypothetical protein